MAAWLRWFRDRLLADRDFCRVEEEVMNKPKLQAIIMEEIPFPCRDRCMRDNCQERAEQEVWIPGISRDMQWGWLLCNQHAVEAEQDAGPVLAEFEERARRAFIQPGDLMGQALGLIALVAALALLIKYFLG